MIPCLALSEPHSRPLWPKISHRHQLLPDLKTRSPLSRLLYRIEEQLECPTPDTFANTHTSTGFWIEEACDASSKICPRDASQNCDPSSQPAETEEVKTRGKKNTRNRLRCVTRHRRGRSRLCGTRPGVCPGFSRSASFPRRSPRHSAYVVPAFFRKRKLKPLIRICIPFTIQRSAISCT